jgi:hypothetical protein
MRKKRDKNTKKSDHRLGNIKEEVPEKQLSAIGALALAFNEVEANASQARNLFAVAENDGKAASLKQSLGRTLVASIVPACGAALRKLAVRVDIEAQPPKLGPFIDAINAALSDPRRLGKS